VAKEIVARDCEMTITQGEFLRLLPAAVAGVPFEFAAGAFHSGDSRRGWRISLSQLPDRVIGAIRLVRYRAVFAFRSHSADEIAAFLRRFDLYFARGGG